MNKLPPSVLTKRTEHESNQSEERQSAMDQTISFAKDRQVLTLQSQCDNVEQTDQPTLTLKLAVQDVSLKNSQVSLNPRKGHARTKRHWTIVH